MVTVADVMREVCNTFPAWEVTGHWEIADTRLLQNTLLLDGDWIAITGADRNKGIWQVACTNNHVTLPGAADEAWDGSIWLLSPPATFLELCAEIAAYDKEHPATSHRQEQYGDYTVTFATDANGLPVSWQQVFAARLLPWRRPWRLV